MINRLTRSILSFKPYKTCASSSKVDKLARIKEYKYRQYIIVSEELQRSTGHCCSWRNEVLREVQSELKNEVDDAHRRWRETSIEEANRRV